MKSIQWICGQVQSSFSGIRKSFFLNELYKVVRWREIGPLPPAETHRRLVDPLVHTSTSLHHAFKPKHRVGALWGEGEGTAFGSRKRSQLSWRVPGERERLRLRGESRAQRALQLLPGAHPALTHCREEGAESALLPQRRPPLWGLGVRRVRGPLPLSGRAARGAHALSVGRRELTAGSALHLYYRRSKEGHQSRRTCRGWVCVCACSRLCVCRVLPFIQDVSKTFSLM